MNEEENKFNLLKLKTDVEEQLHKICECGITPDNINDLYKLIDIHKDISNEEYWKIKEDYYMMYGERDTYGRRRRDSRGRYMDGDRYGKKYYGHEVIDEMAMHYGDYMDSKETARYSGHYSGGEMSKSLDYMLKSIEELMMSLKDEADSHEEIEKIKHTARKISEM